jgi:uncharacterized protein (DUF924 family)
MTPNQMNPQAIVDFWLSDYARQRWFQKDAGFDAEIGRLFQSWIEPAGEGRLGHWEREARTSFALVVLLDQFPRNLFRGRPLAFRYDPAARGVAARAIAAGHDRTFPLNCRFFYYLPAEHSEKLADQAQSMALFRRWVEDHEGAARAHAEEQFHYVRRHQEIIERFGRFPHRNAALGRPSTDAEIAFLKEPMSAF